MYIAFLEEPGESTVQATITSPYTTTLLGAHVPVPARMLPTKMNQTLTIKLAK